MIGKVTVKTDESHNNGYKEGVADCLRAINGLLLIGALGQYPQLGFLTERDKDVLKILRSHIREYIHSPEAPDAPA